MLPLLTTLLLAIPVAVNPAPPPTPPLDPVVLQSQLTGIAPAGSALRVDPATGAVVATLGGQPSKAFVAMAAKHRAKVRWEVGPPVVPLIGGNRISNFSDPPCTAGFRVQSPGGFRYLLTAGHCLSTSTSINWYLDVPPNGQDVYNPTDIYIGLRDRYRFPIQDAGTLVIAYNSLLKPGFTTAKYLGGAEYRVVSARDPVVGEQVCKFGQTTGLTCGTVTNIGVFVTYPEGFVVHMTETDLCSLGGDSGAPLYAVRRVLGVTLLEGLGILSGGNSVCGPGARTYFMLLTSTLRIFDLAVIT